MIEALKPNKHVLKVAFVNTLGVSRAMLLGRFAKGFWEESLIWNKDEAGERPNIYSDRAKASVMGVASLVVGLMELLPYMTTFVGIATLNYWLMGVPWVAKAGFEMVTGIVLNEARAESDVFRATENILGDGIE